MIKDFIVSKTCFFRDWRLSGGILDEKKTKKTPKRGFKKILSNFFIATAQQLDGGEKLTRKWVPAPWKMRVSHGRKKSWPTVIHLQSIFSQMSKSENCSTHCESSYLDNFNENSAGKSIETLQCFFTLSICSVPIGKEKKRFVIVFNLFYFHRHVILNWSSASQYVTPIVIYQCL